jgi:hypothetical protein
VCLDPTFSLIAPQVIAQQAVVISGFCGQIISNIDFSISKKLNLDLSNSPSIYNLKGIE